MPLIVQAIVMGIVQGLTEFLPISSSGHLILVPYLLGWTDPFIDSLAFSVMLHMGTLLALLVYFWRDWVELVPAGLATIRDRSFRGDATRHRAWLIVVTMIPAVVAGPILNDTLEQAIRRPELVAAMLVVGAAILWLADRWGGQHRSMDDLGFGGAFGIGLAQALALIPGISRSGISISAARFLGLDRESAARFSFLMSAPIIAGAGLFEARKLVGAGLGGTHLSLLAAGFVAAALAGALAIHGLLAYLRGHPLTIFVGYRVALAVLVAVLLLAGH